MIIVCNLSTLINFTLFGFLQEMDGLKNTSQVLDFTLPFVYYYYYAMHLLLFSYRHDMKHCSFFCDQCVLRTKNRLMDFILIKCLMLQCLLVPSRSYVNYFLLMQKRYFLQ